MRTGLTVLGASDELPMPVFGEVDYPEETRLTYRFLDLRREKLHAQHDAAVQRGALACATGCGIRALTSSRRRSSPRLRPKARGIFWCRSRLHPGKFYALPQAPQQFKQLIMVAGFDRYFQIAPCFRDEDPRADRSPTDFYQLDIEMSFVEQEDVFAAVQPVVQGIFEEFAPSKKVYSDWPKIAYRDSLKWYGSRQARPAQPDQDAGCDPSISRDSGFAIFAKLLEQEGTEVRAIPAPTGGSRKFCDRMNAFAQKEGLPGMGYIFWREAEDGSGMEAAGPLGQEHRAGTHRGDPPATGPGLGDAAFFLGGKPEAFEAVAGRARNEIGRELGLTEKDCFKFAWIVDFPMYEKTDEGKIDFSHNPFSMPQGGLEALKGDPLKVYAYQYDLACNGYELISGGIRNHKPEIMFKAFELAGYPNSEVEKRFGGMVKAFKYGAPPHGGCAAGIDRIVMLLADEANIREVIMFPMNQRAEDLLMGAPSEPMNAQLRELSLRVVPKD